MVFVVRVRDIQNCQIERIRVRGSIAWYFENLGNSLRVQSTSTQCEFPTILASPNHAVFAPVVVRGLEYVFNYGERRYLAYKGYKKEETIECSFKLKNIIYPYFYYVVGVRKNNTVLYQRFSYFDLLNQSWSPAVPMAPLL
jgi:hypothetical protein